MKRASAVEGSLKITILVGLFELSTRLFSSGGETGAEDDVDILRCLEEKRQWWLNGSCADRR